MLEILDLQVAYGAIKALDGVSFAVPRGQIVALLGANGAGKTTAIRILTGLDTATSGRATILGADPAKGGPEARRRIGYMPQQPRFYGWMTGREFLEFIGATFGLKGATLRARVDSALERTGMKDSARRRTAGYSGGMQQRLALAQVLVSEPELLLLDEPAASLDPAGRRDILEIVSGLRGKATVLMSTHILADVERVCDVVGIINKGRLVTESPLHELQARYAQPVFVLEPEPGQGEAVERLTAALRAQPWTASALVEHGELHLVARDPQRASREVLPLVAQSGVALARMERARPSLEEIFLRLVGDAHAAETKAQGG